MKIVVATHNEGKLVEIRNILTEQLSAAAQGIELVSAGSLPPSHRAPASASSNSAPEPPSATSATSPPRLTHTRQWAWV